MIKFDLPKSLEINGKEWNIRTDYRDILTVISAFDDPDLEPAEKVYICLHNIYVDFEDIPQEQYKDAFEAAMDFINRGGEDEKAKSRKKNMDWEQDANLIFPAVNRVAGCEVRAVEYLHWWTFFGYFMEITDGVYSTVLSLRAKKNSGKKLEKWEQEWWNKNLSICKIKTKYTQEELDKQARYKAMLGGR